MSPLSTSSSSTSSHRGRRTMALVATVTASMVMLVAGAATAQAGGDGPAPADPPGSTETRGQVITVSVSGTGYSAGSSGSGAGAGGGQTSVTVPAPCWMDAWVTGKEYAAYVASGQGAYFDSKLGDRVGSFPGYEQHQDDDQGRWYTGTCYSGNWPDQDDISGWFPFSDTFFLNNPPVFVPADAEPPMPPVPPELLRDIAIDNLTLPDPELNWNPKRLGNQGTLVNLDTWLWLDNAPRTLEVRASAGGNEASVTATFQGMDITAPGERALSCAGPGTPYTSGANSTCSLAFRQASTRLGSESTPVTVKTTWTGTWAVNDVNQGPIATQPAPVTETTNIRVDEIQALVTGGR